eukprot:TRINITY_DN1755_c0_g2_i2.p1 TRINITY_DN1755_c0_g2~~TRINITY_DN1755_c0_g2_i2.p1  ORF type:complete len:125 (+),score=19.75 TRINITY_DN1755_c0_g2_i2:234-608(+)
MGDSRAIELRLEGESILHRTEVLLPEEVSTVFKLQLFAERVFELTPGSVTAILWDDEQERGLKVRRDKEICRLRDGDQLCLRYNKPPRWGPKPQPWYVEKDRSYPSLRELEVQRVSECGHLQGP